MIQEKLKTQLENNKVVTEESLLEMKSKAYHNGDEIKVGDKILFAVTLDIDENDQKSITLIMISENQIDLYELDDRYISNTLLPAIKLK